jgi:hypothetical protein
MATFEGGVVTPEMIPAEVKQAFPLEGTSADFTARLKAGGTMELIDTVHVIGKASFTTKSKEFYALDKVILTNSTIVTNGNTLLLFCNEFHSNNGHIVAFADDSKKASNGAVGAGTGEAGDRGEPGVAGGLTSLHVIQQLQGTLFVDMSGQNGGDGGNGAAGGSGASGVKGENPQSGVFGCNHAGGNGSQGGTGGAGGHGGDGGNGGSGGYFELYNVGSTPIDNAAYNFKGDAGIGGIGENGGPGGPGGPGGQGGDGGGFCGGGAPGAAGAPGSGGAPGAAGKNAAAGQVIVKNLDLEVITGLARTKPPIPA